MKDDFSTLIQGAKCLFLVPHINTHPPPARLSVAWKVGAAFYVCESQSFKK